MGNNSKPISYMFLPHFFLIQLAIYFKNHQNIHLMFNSQINWLIKPKLNLKTLATSYPYKYTPILTKKLIPTLWQKSQNSLNTLSL